MFRPISLQVLTKDHFRHIYLGVNVFTVDKVFLHFCLVQQCVFKKILTCIQTQRSSVTLTRYIVFIMSYCPCWFISVYVIMFFIMRPTQIR